MENQQRPDRDTYFMTIALVVSLRSTCLRGQVGAILVLGDRIISTGYNGAPRGFPHCTEETCGPHIDHCRATVHAELNTIISAATHGTSTLGSTLYTTLEPCDACWFALVNAGIARVYYWKPYLNHHPHRFERMGMEIFQAQPVQIVWMADHLQPILGGARCLAEK